MPKSTSDSCCDDPKQAGAKAVGLPLRRSSPEMSVAARYAERSIQEKQRPCVP